MTKTIILARVSLPCNVSDLEAAIHLAAHEGHWHDAKVSLGEDGKTLTVGYPTEEA